jgi:hypothetical protein
MPQAMGGLWDDIATAAKGALEAVTKPKKPETNTNWMIWVALGYLILSRRR